MTRLTLNVCIRRGADVLLQAFTLETELVGGADEAFYLVRLYARAHGIRLAPDLEILSTKVRGRRFEIPLAPERIDITEWLEAA